MKTIRTTTVLCLMVLSSLVVMRAAMGLATHDDNINKEVQQQQQERELQQDRATIESVRWIHAGTNLPIVVNGSTNLVLPPGSVYINTDDIPVSQLTVETRTNGTNIGSIGFKLDQQFENATQVGPLFLKYQRREYHPRYAMCGNNKDDFFQCPPGIFLVDNDTDGFKDALILSVSIYTAAQQLDNIRYHYLYLYSLMAPTFTLYMVNPVTDEVFTSYPLEEEGNGWITDPDWGNPQYWNVWLNVSYPNGMASHWIPSHVEFNYDGVKRIDSVAPYSAFGNKGNDFDVFAPTNGKHTLVATVYKKNGDVGYVAKTSFTIQNGP